ncbi:MAG TPA: gluconate 2-dehydrogenase subunit 3 family protein [Bryobacteraceae bacterium]|nr:gluconate 2-dehydrogenase subunit 3 family protein [Bryobacteraceae bacterium]
MTQNEVSRREWILGSSMGILAVWPQIVAAQEHAHRAAATPGTAFKYFDRQTAAEVEAIAAQIIPTDETPGAREAGVIYFIDHALSTFDKESQEHYKSGLADLQEKREKMFPGSRSISGLRPEQQLELVKAIDGTPFFETVRTHTIIGFLNSPDEGGNRDYIGWKLLGMDPRMVYEPPFGYYDAEAQKEGTR